MIVAARSREFIVISHAAYRNWRWCCLFCAIPDKLARSQCLIKCQQQSDREWCYFFSLFSSSLFDSSLSCWQGGLTAFYHHFVCMVWHSPRFINTATFLYAGLKKPTIRHLAVFSVPVKEVNVGGTSNCPWMQVACSGCVKQWQCCGLAV